jgi:hypothetical protein
MPEDINVFTLKTDSLTAHRFSLPRILTIEYSVVVLSLSSSQRGKLIMKRLSAVTVLILAVALFAASQTTEQKLTGKNLKIKQELIKLEEEWHNAYVRHAAEPLERILADDYIAVYSNGKSVDKAQSIEDLKADKSIYDYSTPYDMDMRFYDNTVVIIGRTKDKWKNQKGEDLTAEYRWTDVFVKRNGRWRCVAAQVVRIPPPPKS